MRLVVALLVICACGRLNFEGAEEGLAITSPAENAEVQATALLAGTCRTGVPIALAGGGLASPSSTTCDAGAFGELVAFTDGDGPKLVTVAQGGVTIARTFTRVTPAMLRSSSVGTRGSAGFMVDCDLDIARPPGLVAGDLLFGVIYTDGGGNGSVATSGFTRTTLQGPMYVAFWKVVGVAEPATYTFRVVAGTGTADTCESAGVLAAFAGIDDANPVLAESANVGGNGSTGVVALGVTAPKPGILVGAWGSNGPGSGFMQAGMTLAGAAISNADFANALLAYEGVAAGPTGDRTATLQQPRGAAAGLFVLAGKP